MNHSELAAQTPNSNLPASRAVRRLFFTAAMTFGTIWLVSGVLPLAFTFDEIPLLAKVAFALGTACGVMTITAGALGLSGSDNSIRILVFSTATYVVSALLELGCIMIVQSARPFVISTWCSFIGRFELEILYPAVTIAAVLTIPRNAWTTREQVFPVAVRRYWQSTGKVIAVVAFLVVGLTSMVSIVGSLINIIFYESPPATVHDGMITIDLSRQIVTHYIAGVEVGPEVLITIHALNAAAYLAMMLGGVLSCLRGGATFRWMACVAIALLLVSSIVFALPFAHAGAIDSDRHFLAVNFLALSFPALILRAGCSVFVIILLFRRADSGL